MTQLSDQQRFDWLRLARVSGVGPRTFQGLINRFGGAAAALEALPALARGKGRSIIIPPKEEIARELARAEALGAQFIGYGETAYPAALRDIDGPPPLVAVKGRLDLLERPTVGLVGSRNASAGGRKIAGDLAAALGAAGFAVASGFARGIDAAAHQASLATGTIGVLAGGLDRPYPPENLALFEQMAEQGLVLTEMPFGWVPRGRDFPRRNRLISGLSLGVVVVEAARRSGSLITARMANEQGRVVFAVPGSPLDPRAEGTNDLLRAGATIAMSAEDVLAVLRPMAGEGRRMPMLFREPSRALSDADDPLFDESLGDGHGMDAEDDSEITDDAAPRPVRERLLSLLSVTPVDADQVARSLGVDARELAALLFDLELAGELDRHPGNRISRRP